MFSYVATAFAAAAYVSAAPMYLTPAARQGCDAVACGIAVAPTGVGCVSAAAQLGADPFSDAGCVASVVNLGVNTPAVCQPCVSTIGDTVKGVAGQVGDAVTGVAGDVGDAVAGAVDDVKDVFGGLFGRQDTCDFVKCGVALGPTGVSCVSAAAELGANPFADAGCAISVVNLGLNVPDACRACVDQAKAAIPEPLQPAVEAVDDAKDAINDGIDTVVDGAKDIFGGLFGRQDTCDIAACGIAVAPSGVGCVSAAVQLGADPFADAGCVASAVNLGVNTPPVCQPCFASLGQTVKDTAGQVGDAVTDVAGDVGDAVTGAFDDVKDIFGGLF
ncbi:hypothetical protein DL96DRAFT_377242 [Flagelloscypha sp. PMI_526]|nr:hypothetical protein DL96DRAFT_377242 [Flagelloscypha sp. PMI_526]